MSTESTLTSKGETTVPKAIRESLAPTFIYRRLGSGPVAARRPLFAVSAVCPWTPRACRLLLA